MRIFLLLLLGYSTLAQNTIPKLPRTARQTFTISSNSYNVLAAPALAEPQHLLETYLGPASSAKRKMPIFLEVSAGISANPEFYRLRIEPQAILIEGQSLAGVQRGIQTLRMLWLLGQNQDSVTLPLVALQDEPAFPHRGMLLDVARHFFSVETVKEIIDLLAFYKMNTLHWHLTEDQGWRLAIDGYPNLTQVGAYRTETDGSITGGFYTKQEIKEVVAHAAARGIAIIPEIEMPGHSLAAIASYPWLSCTGQPVEVTPEWGVFKDIYCAGNDSVFHFLENVLSEVMELFPSTYIHIGGDEAPKYRWEQCPKCQKRMAQEGLTDEHELQSYFITRIEKFLNAHGRQLIGWDEILEGGLSPNATVQSWRGTDFGKEAAQQKHRVIMSPTSHCYLDYSLKQINLERVYGFNPIPNGLDPEFHPFVVGAEVNVWTEHVPTDSVLHDRILPRMLALAEVLWNGPGGDYADFYQRIQHHYPMLRSLGFVPGLEAEPITVRTALGERSSSLVLYPGLENLALEFNRGDGWQPCPDKVVPITGKETIALRASKNGQPYGTPKEVQVWRHLAVGQDPIYVNPFSSFYPGNLVDGVLGTPDFRDGFWQGFAGNDMDVHFDFDTAVPVHHVALNCYQYSNAWIMAPKRVEVFVSSDGINWETVGKVTPLQTEAGARGIVPIDIEFESTPARFVRVVAEHAGKLPAWHDAAGSNAWLFVDEVVVE